MRRAGLDARARHLVRALRLRGQRSQPALFKGPVSGGRYAALSVAAEGLAALDGDLVLQLQRNALLVATNADARVPAALSRAVRLGLPSYLAVQVRIQKREQRKR